MQRCPISLEECSEERYAPRGLRLLSPQLTDLREFPYSAEEQRREAIIRAAKMSIQGVQPKLSAVLSVKDQVFRLTNRGGRYVIKPQHAVYPALPENEAITMRMAQIAGIEVPVHGLLYSRDTTMSYFIRRFDRIGQGKKLAVEDFAQLSGESRETKYDSSMEKLVGIVNRFCTFPVIEKARLLKRSLFNFLVGNEDMHLKNFSVITRGGKVELAPGYDFLSTTIAFQALGKSLGDIEEVALPLGGKKKSLTARMWLDYYAKERLGLNDKVVDGTFRSLSLMLSSWYELISMSFLPDSQKGLFRELLDTRWNVLSR